MFFIKIQKGIWYREEHYLRYADGAWLDWFFSLNFQCKVNDTLLDCKIFYIKYRQGV